MLKFIVVMVLAGFGIFLGSKWSESSASKLGARWNVPSVIMGGLVIAIISSFAELMSVILLTQAGEFAGGIAVVAGSAIANLIWIKLVTRLGAGKDVPTRTPVIVLQAIPYLVVVVLTIVAIGFVAESGSNGHEWKVLTTPFGGIAIILFVAFVYMQFAMSKRFPLPKDDEDEEAADSMSVAKETVMLVIGMGLIGVSCHFMVEVGMEFAKHNGMPIEALAVTVFALVTSVPDILMSYFLAKKGQTDAAISNAYGSNVFDILVCLGLPVLVLGHVEVDWSEGSTIMYALLGGTVVGLAFLLSGQKLEMWEAMALVVLYGVFVVAVFVGGILWPVFWACVGLMLIATLLFGRK
ncbi:MAG: hypothetical protein ABIH21_05595 [Patescibacteria group bacterium]